MATNPTHPAPEQYWEQCEKRATELLLRYVLCLEGTEGHVRERYLEAWLMELKQYFLNEIHSYEDARKPIERWLEELVETFQGSKIFGVDRGNQVFDEELVRLANGGVEEARVELMERYSPRIKNIVASIVYKHDVCPPSQDIPAYIEDVAQNVCVKITEKLSTYRFEQPFDHWVKKICSNEAYGEKRDIVGRAEGGPRVYISWEDFLEHPASSAIQQPEHVDMLHKILNQHRSHSQRGKKSHDAIFLKYYEDLDAEEVAFRLGTTKDYVYQLLSHDYSELRRIGIDYFGISGTDL